MAVVASLDVAGDVPAVVPDVDDPAEFDALLVWAPEPSELQAANTVAPAAAAMASRPRRLRGVGVVQHSVLGPYAGEKKSCSSMTASSDTDTTIGALGASTP